MSFDTQLVVNNFFKWENFQSLNECIYNNYIETIRQLKLTKTFYDNYRWYNKF